MPETLTVVEPQQEDKNLEILGSSELGKILEQVYLEAINLDPRLENVEIVPIEEDSSSIAQVRPAWASETGKHQVRLRLENLDGALAKTGEALDKIPGAKEIFASKLGIPAESMTPQMLYVFGVAHELGHVTEYMDFEGDPEKLRRRQKAEKVALPIGNASVSAVMTEGTAAHGFVEDNWGDISRHFKINSFEELLEEQHNAYRGMTSERVADDFAGSVFRMNPTIVDQMTGPNLHEYRASPVAA